MCAGNPEGGHHKQQQLQHSHRLVVDSSVRVASQSTTSKGKQKENNAVAERGLDSSTKTGFQLGTSKIEGTTPDFMVSDSSTVNAGKDRELQMQRGIEDKGIGPWLMLSSSKKQHPGTLNQGHFPPDGGYTRQQQHSRYQNQQDGRFPQTTQQHSGSYCREANRGPMQQGKEGMQPQPAGGVFRASKSEPKLRNKREQQKLPTYHEEGIAAGPVFTMGAVEHLPEAGNRKNVGRANKEEQGKLIFYEPGGALFDAHKKRKTLTQNAGDDAFPFMPS